MAIRIGPDKFNPPRKQKVSGDLVASKPQRDVVPGRPPAAVSHLDRTVAAVCGGSPAQCQVAVHCCCRRLGLKNGSAYTRETAFLWSRNANLDLPRFCHPMHENTDVEITEKILAGVPAAHGGATSFGTRC